MELIRMMNILCQSGAAVVKRPAVSFFHGDINVGDLQLDTIDKTVAFQRVTTLRSRNSCPPGPMRCHEVDIIVSTRPLSTVWLCGARIQSYFDVDQ